MNGTFFMCQDENEGVFQPDEPEYMTGSKAITEIHNNTFKAPIMNAELFKAMFAKLLPGQEEPPHQIDMTGIERDNIVLNEYMRVGDVVVMHLDSETRQYRTNEVPDGTVGIIYGFVRYKDYHERINNWGQEVGVFEKNGAAEIMWTNGTVCTLGGSDVRFFGDAKQKQKQRREDKAGSAEYKREDRLGDLPETPIWEYDIVRVLRTARNPWREHNLLRVTKIDYRYLEQKRSDGSPMPPYTCTPIEAGHGTCSMGPDEIELVERGNVWKWFNGQRDQVKFATLEEELAFHFALGNDEQIKCEQSDSWHWPASAILPALEAGLIDVIKRSPGFFGASDSMAGHKMTDPDLSKRAREFSIQGYKKEMRMCVIADEWNEFSRHFVIRRALEMQLPFINVLTDKGYVDTKQLEVLGIQVTRFNPKEAKDSDLPKGSFIYFSPKGSGVYLDHTTVNELDEQSHKLSRAFKRNKDDHFEVRVQSDKGWSEKNRNICIEACKAFGVKFADRAAVADEEMRKAGIEIVNVNDEEKMPITFEIDGYVFFSHRGMKDLSYHVSIQGE